MVKKALLVLAVIAVLLTAGLFIVKSRSKDTDSASTQPYTTTDVGIVGLFMQAVADGDTDKAYTISKNNSLSKPEFSNFMGQIKDSVNLEKCVTTSIGSTKDGSAITLVQSLCPYKVKGFAEYISLVFSVRKVQDNQYSIISYDTSYR